MSINQNSALKSFIHVLQKAPIYRTFEEYIEVHEHFVQFLKANFIPELIDAGLEKYRNEDNFIVFNGHSPLQVTIPVNAHFSLDFTIIRGGTDASQVVHSYPFHVMLGAKHLEGDCEITAEIYGLDKQAKDDEFSAQLLLKKLNYLSLSDNHNICCEAGKMLVNIVPPEKDILLITLRSKPVLPFMWEFSLDSLQAKRAMHAHASSSRLIYAAHLLAADGSEQSLESLIKLSKHNEYDVRWVAIQNVFKLDKQKGIEMLKAATKDQHPTIRRSAETNLARISQCFSPDNKVRMAG